MKKVINILAHYFLTLIVLGYIVYEELVWERLAKPIVRYVNSFSTLQKLESHLHHVNGTVILFIFMVLFVVAELQGIYAGILLLEGKILHGVIMYAGKIPVAAFTFWLFRVTKPKLMAFDWFEKSYDMVMRWIDWVKATDAYTTIKTKYAEFKAYIKKNYLSDDDSLKERIQQIYRRLKIRVKEALSE